MDETPTPSVPDEPAPTPEQAEAVVVDQNTPTTKHARLQRYKEWYLERKKWTIPSSILALVIILSAVPFTRYQLAGLVYKKNFTVVVTDSVSGSPVSGATVSLGSKSAQTNGAGKATIHLAVGLHKLSLVKKYYQSRQALVTVPILSEKSTPDIMLVATGRQVQIQVTNLISKQALSEVSISVADITAKTDKNGNALLVLPANLATAAATLQLAGYNQTTTKITISDKSVQQNNATMVPAGKVYFLSKLSGKIDVVKTNLDGSERQTVLAGTGNEEDTGTVLLASRDWKYLALLSQRDTSGNPSLYLIDTATDKLTTIDEGDAQFTPEGWIKNNFAYEVVRNSVAAWQPKSVALKLYNASTKTISTVFENQTTGDQYNYALQNLSWVQTSDDSLTYFAAWSAHHTNASVNFQGELGDKQDQVVVVSAADNSKKVIKSYSLGTQSNYITSYYYPLSSYSAVQYKPDVIYFQTSDNTGASTSYKLDSGKLSENDPGAAEYFSKDQTSNTYLLSPSGTQTFWAEARDGKNTLLIGDSGGNSPKQIANLSDYYTYGWYSDNYLLVSKNSSELYIIPAAGIKFDTDAIKITDYHKPIQSYYGYGGGYGGL